jgi:hypothetical protein
MRPLGTHQLRTLLIMASPAVIMLTPDKVARSLAGRGLLKQHTETCGALRITAAGMRVLADAYEAGALDEFMRGDPPPPTP